MQPTPLLIRLGAGAIALLCSHAVSADVSMPRIFSDNMVLQQESRVALWGKADPGEKITAEGSWGASARGEADSQGNWKLFVETPEHGEPQTLTVKGKNTLTFNNVELGEVWLAAGQSNMGWAVGESFGAEEALANASNPDLRIFKTAMDHWGEPLDDLRDQLAQWQVADAESVRWTSATGYYFAEKLQKELGVPVGLIVTAYPGTLIEGWSPLGAQKENPTITRYKERINSKAEEQARNDAFAKYEKDYAKYLSRVIAGETTASLNTDRPLNVPRITRPFILNANSPGYTFNAMIHPIRPYGIRGMIWYQGERNARTAGQVELYADQLEQMVSYYRSSWHELSDGGVADDFPVYVTQLPSWFPAQEKPVEGMSSTWVTSREQMLIFNRDVENSGLTVTIDTGDAIDLHPRAKQEIGLRHAYQALSKAYGWDFVAEGPVFKSYQVEGNEIELAFTSVGSGLMPAKDAPLDSFAIAGEDQQWHWAEARIEDDKVVVSSKLEKEPVAVRYAWAMNPSQRNLLYNREGIPASPFRTDDWSLRDSSVGLDERFNNPPREKGYQMTDWQRPEMTQ